MSQSDLILFDAGMFIGALLQGRDWSQLRQSHLAFGRFIRILPRHRFIRQEWKISIAQL